MLRQAAASRNAVWLRGRGRAIRRAPSPGVAVRFLWIYLSIYVALIAAAIVALSSSGVLAHLSPLAIAVTVVVVLGLGALLAAVSLWKPKRPA